MADTSFRELTLGGFVDVLGSAEPVPGGGSASAVAASLGAALVAMVASLSDRPKYADHSELHRRSIETGRRLAKRFLDLADEDSEAYAGFAAAMKMPKDDEAQKAARSEALRVAARRAAEVPLATVQACLELVAAAETLVGRSNVNAASDLNVAALLGEAAARGAAENVLVNLPSVGDPAWVGETTANVMGLLDTIEELAAATHAGVSGGESRDQVTVTG